jgi:hypothetical protein
MTESIRPEDVGPDDTRKLLDFLNKAKSAEELAEAIEIEGELDVGLKLGQRILDRRDQLGAFHSLSELDEIKQIGPKRFTRIVQALTGRPPVRPEVNGAAVARLEQEVAALRLAVQSLASVHAAPRVTLRALGPPRYLGQPTSIVATVTDAGGTSPQPDVPVVFSASWGRLSTFDGYTVQSGASVTARTGLDGTATVTLSAPTSEDLLDLQQAALESALRSLDPAAQTPQDARTGLEQLAEQYAWEPNDALRGGVDVYFRDFRGRLLETVNFRDSLQTWAQFDSTVVAYAQDGAAGADPDSYARGVAALTLHLRDWLGPWLEVFVEAAEAANSLVDDIHTATREETEASALVDRVHNSIGEFLEGRLGVVGSYVGNRLAQAAVKEYATRTFDVLPEETRTAVFPALHATAKTLATAGSSVVAALHTSGSVVRGAVESKVGELSEAIGSKLDASDLDAALASTGAFTALKSQVDAKLDASALDSALAVSPLIISIRTPPTTTGTVAEIEPGIVETFSTELAGKLDASALDTALADSTVIGDLTTQLADKVDTSQLETTVATKVEADTLDAALASKVDTTTFSDALAAKVDESTLATAVSDKVDVATLDDALRSKLDAAALEDALASKVDASAFETALAGKVDNATLGMVLANKIDATQLEAALAGKVDEAALAAALSLKIDVSTLAEALADKVGADELAALLTAKADAAAVEEGLAAKLDAADLGPALATKADAAAVDEALAAKLDVAALAPALAAKADAAAVDRALAGKVDTDTFTTALATKVDTTTFTQALATKVDTTTFTTALATKVDTTTFTQALATKVDTSTFSTALAKKVDTATFTTGLATKADTTTVTALQTQVSILTPRIRLP